MCDHICFALDGTGVDHKLIICEQYLLDAYLISFGNLLIDKGVSL